MTFPLRHIPETGVAFTSAKRGGNYASSNSFGYRPGLLTSATWAADAVVEVVEVQQPAFTWSGVYVGGIVGYGWSEKDAFDAEEPVDTGAYDVDGFIGGLEVGVNWQFNRFLIGVEADVLGSAMDGDGFIDGDDPISTDINLLATGTGRLGFICERVLFYFEAGAAWIDEDHTFEGGGISDTISNDEFGYVVGGGIEYAFADRWSVKFEYNYMDFGSEEHEFDVDEPEIVDIDQSVQAVKLGLNYRF